MAGKPAIEIKGGVEFRRAMKAMNADLKDLTAVNRKAADIVATTARDIAPRMTGRLARSIKVRASKSSARVQAGSDLIPYAGVIHFGWPAHSIEPQPFLWDAADVSTNDVVDEYERHIANLVRKVDRMTPDR